MSSKNEDQVASSWQVKPAQMASILLVGIYLSGFLVLNAHLNKRGLYDFDLANSRHLIAGVLFVGFLVSWYLFSGRAIILLKKGLAVEIASAKEHGLSPIWHVLIFINSLVKFVFLTCLSAGFFSIAVLGSTEPYPVYLGALFLIACSWDILNLNLRFPRANQVFEFVSKTAMILVFFITMHTIVSPTMFVFFQFIVMSLYANLVLDSYERFKATTDQTTYNIIFSVVFVLLFSTSFGRFHYGGISSAFGGGQLQPVEILVEDQSVRSGLRDMGVEVTPSLKAELIHENPQEIFLDVEGQTMRLSRDAVAVFKVLPVEDKHWLLRYLN